MGVIARSHDTAWRMATIAIRCAGDAWNVEQSKENHGELYQLFRIELERFEWNIKREQHRLNPLAFHEDTS